MHIMAITKQEVFAHADAMFAEGVQPTLILLRKALGSGSFSTISGYLAEWKNSTRAGEVPAAGDAPEEILELFTAPLGALWSRAVALASEAAATVEAESKALVSAALLRETEALALAQSVQDELDTFDAQVLKLQGRISFLEEQLINAQVAVAEAKATEKEFRAMHAQVVAAFKARKVQKPEKQLNLKLTKNTSDFRAPGQTK